MDPGLPVKMFAPVWMAASVRPGFDTMWDRRQRWGKCYVRLKPGMNLDQAKAGLQPLFHQVVESEVTMPAFRNATFHDKYWFRRMWVDAMPGSQGNTGLRRQYKKPLLGLVGGAGPGLLIACAN